MVSLETWLSIFQDRDLNWERIHKSPSLSISYIERNPQIDWNYRWLTYNPNLTLEFIEKNIDRDWDFKGLSSIKYVLTLEFIEKYKDKPWDIDALIRNQFIRQKVGVVCGLTQNHPNLYYL